MTETVAAPAPAEAKPNHGLSQIAAVALMKANRANAANPAPPPAAPAPEPAAEAANPEPGEPMEATSVEGDEQPEAEIVTDEQPEATAEEPAADGMELGDDSKLILPDGTEWTAKELAEGVLRLKDYTKKTQALAEERRAVDVERSALQGKAKELETGLTTRITELESERAAARAERERYATEVEQIRNLLNQQGADWAKVDWQAERARDPVGAAAKWMDYQLHREAMAAADRERADLTAKQQADDEAAKKATNETAMQMWQQRKDALEGHITAKYPELLDPEKGNQKWQAMAATAKASGLPEEVFLATFGQRHVPGVPIMDAPVFDWLRKATLYDALTAEHSKATASGTAPKPDASGKIRVVKGTAPRFRPPSAAASELGRATAAFNANPNSREAATRLMKAKRIAAASRG